MLAALIAGLLVALAAPALLRTLRGGALALCCGLTVLLLLLVLQFLPEIAAGRVWRLPASWSVVAGLEASAYIDGLSLFAGLGLLLLSALSIPAAAPSTAIDRDARGLRSQLVLLVGGLGIVFCDSILLVAGSALVMTLGLMLGQFSVSGRAGAARILPLLAVWLAADIAFAGALVLLAIAGETSEISLLLLRNDQVRAHAYAPAAAALLAAFLALKAGLLPFQVLAARFRRAPLLVRVGIETAVLPFALVYILARFTLLLPQGNWVPMALAGLACASALTAGLSALRARGLTLRLAHLNACFGAGALALVALATPISVVAGLALCLGQGAARTALLAFAEQLTRRLGTDHIERMAGRWRDAPFTSVLFFLAALAVAGIVPSLALAGFVSAYGALLASPAMPVVLGALMLAHVLGAIAALLVPRTLMRRGVPLEGMDIPRARSARRATVLGAVLLFMTCAAATILSLADRVLFVPAVSAALHYKASASLALDAGDQMALLLVLGVVALVLIGVWRQRFIEAFVARIDRLFPRAPFVWLTARIGGAAVAGLMMARRLKVSERTAAALAAAAIGLLVLIVGVQMILAGGGALVLAGTLTRGTALVPLAILVILGAVASVKFEHALIFLGLAGALAAVTALAAGGADIAYAMLAILIVETALMLMLAPRLKELHPPDGRRIRRVLEAGLVALFAAGAGVAAIALAAAPVAQPLADALDWPVYAAVAILLMLAGIPIVRLARPVASDDRIGP